MGEYAIKNKSVSDTQDEYNRNDPPVKANQRWICFDREGEVYRRLRILAMHPDPDFDGKRQWIYVDEAAKMRIRHLGELRVCPEFNLRYVFQLEQ